MMVEEGLADGLLSGLTMPYPDTIRPALLVSKTRTDVKKVAGLYLLILKDRVLFLADTTVNVNPTAEEAGGDRQDGRRDRAILRH